MVMCSKMLASQGHPWTAEHQCPDGSRWMNFDSYTLGLGTWFPFFKDSHWNQRCEYMVHLKTDGVDTAVWKPALATLHIASLASLSCILFCCGQVPRTWWQTESSYADRQPLSATLNSHLLLRPESCIEFSTSETQPGLCEDAVVMELKCAHPETQWRLWNPHLLCSLHLSPFSVKWMKDHEGDSQKVVTPGCVFSLLVSIRGHLPLIFPKATL